MSKPKLTLMMMMMIMYVNILVLQPGILRKSRAEEWTLSPAS